RLRRYLDDPEPHTDFLDAAPFDVLPLEHVSVASWEAIEHRLDELSRLFPAVAMTRLVVRRRFNRFEDRAHLGTVLDQDDLFALALPHAQVIHDLPAADLADPGEQRRIAPVGSETADRLRQRRLYDFLRCFGVGAQAGQRKAIDAREIVVEERVEGALISREHPSYQVSFVRHAVYPESYPGTVYPASACWTSKGGEPIGTSMGCTEISLPQQAASCM